MISDNGVFIETKKAYAKDMVTGFIRLNGMTVGAVANRSKVYDEEGNTAEEFDGTLSAMGCKKAAETFVKFCDAFGIPVLTLTNVKGTQGNCMLRKEPCKRDGSSHLCICRCNCTKSQCDHR